MIRKPYVLFVVLLLVTSVSVFADTFHYNNFLIGDRAMGLGGAYAGVSDDASGVYYNPAGLGFALSNDISGSANAFYQKKTTYKKTIAGEDFVENSGGSLPSFFGGLQKLDKYVQGLVFAFGVFTIDGDLKDQNDLIKDKTLNTNKGCTVTETGEPSITGRPDTVLARLHRTVNFRGSSVYSGAALGWRVTNNLSLGFGLNYVTVSELHQEYQDVRQNTPVCDSDGSGNYTNKVQTNTQNLRLSLNASGVEPVLAVQYALPGNLSLGLAVKGGSYLSQSFEQQVEVRGNGLTIADQAKVDTGANTEVGDGAMIFANTGEFNMTKPLGSALPYTVRFGAAYFHSTRLLLTSDAIYHSAVSDAEKLPGSSVAFYTKQAVIDYAAGLEYYLLPTVPLRLGFFTNNDTRPMLDKTKKNQLDHVDYTGSSIFAAWVQPNSQIGVGFVLQSGTGTAQKTGGNATQTVEAFSRTFAFSASHSF